MQFGSLRTELIYDTIKSEILAINEGNITKAFFSKSIELVKKEYPQLEEEQVLSIIELVGNALLEKREKISLVATVPLAFSLKTKRIQNVAEELIRNAKKKHFIDRIFSIRLYFKNNRFTDRKKSKRCPGENFL